MSAWLHLRVTPVHTGRHDTRGVWETQTQYITEFDIVILTEPPALLHGSSAATQCSLSLPHGCSRCCNCYGSSSLSLSDQTNSTIWLTIKPAQSRQQPLILGVCCIRPDSHHSAQLSRGLAQVKFESLAARVAQLSTDQCLGVGSLQTCMKSKSA